MIVDSSVRAIAERKERRRIRLTLAARMRGEMVRAGPHRSDQKPYDKFAVPVARLSPVLSAVLRSFTGVGDAAVADVERRGHRALEARRHRDHRLVAEPARFFRQVGMEHVSRRRLVGS